MNDMNDVCQAGVRRKHGGQHINRVNYEEIEFPRVYKLNIIHTHLSNSTLNMLETKFPTIHKWKRSFHCVKDGAFVQFVKNRASAQNKYRFFEEFTLGGKICKYISPYKKLSYYRRLWRWEKNKRKKDKIHSFMEVAVRLIIWTKYPYEIYSGIAFSNSSYTHSLCSWVISGLYI